MKFTRLWQPRNPAFWLMIALNLLSTLLAWFARNHDLVPAAALMVAGFAVANGLIGLYLMWLLTREIPAKPESSG